jgi:hypothetical protein
VVNKKKDEYDPYGQYIARKLRRMDERTRAYVQKAFVDLIFDAELGEYASHPTQAQPTVIHFSPDHQVTETVDVQPHISRPTSTFSATSSTT